jgi:hypothetical protein
MGLSRALIRPHCHQLCEKTARIVLRNRLLERFIRDLPRCHGLHRDTTFFEKTTEFSPLRRWNPSFIGAVLALLAWLMVATAEVQAGCSHLVRSRSDRVRLPSILQGAFWDREDGAAASSLPPSLPSSPGSCRGAWCGGGPGVPAVPAATVDGRLGPWACWTPIPELLPILSSFLAPPTMVLNPVDGGSAVFHPPRRLSSA